MLQMNVNIRYGTKTCQRKINSRRSTHEKTVDIWNRIFFSIQAPENGTGDQRGEGEIQEMDAIEIEMPATESPNGLPDSFVCL